MSLDEMLSASVDLMLLGMGTVFCILGLLIACIALMSKWYASPAAAPAGTVTESGKTGPERAAGVVAAIQAAVHVHRGAASRKS